MTRLAIIHTTPATVDSLKTLAAEILPGVEVINFVDDSILPQLARNGANVSEVEERLLAYAKFATQAGANAILEACSSVGEVAAKMRQVVSVPVVRIDDAMAEEAVLHGSRLGVAATLETTLQPTTRLLVGKAEALGKQVTVIPVLIQGAYQKLMSGDREGHDRLLVEGLTKLAQETDAVVLAQASMARVVPSLPADQQSKILSSPRLAMEQVKKALGK